MPVKGGPARATVDSARMCGPCGETGEIEEPEETERSYVGFRKGGARG